MSTFDLSGEPRLGHRRPETTMKRWKELRPQSLTGDKFPQEEYSHPARGRSRRGGIVKAVNRLPRPVKLAAMGLIGFCVVMIARGALYEIGSTIVKKYGPPIIGLAMNGRKDVHSRINGGPKQTEEFATPRDTKKPATLKKEHKKRHHRPAAKRMHRGAADSLKPSIVSESLSDYNIQGANKRWEAISLQA